MKKVIIALLVVVSMLCTNATAAEKPSEEMARKLKIIIPKVKLKNVTPEQALEFLRRVSRDMDPEGKGINIIYVKSTKPKTQK